MINFIKNLFGFSLKSKAMKVLNKKFEDAQKEYDSDVEDLKIRKSTSLFNLVQKYNEEVANTHYSFKVNKESVEEKHLNKILSKLL